VVTIGKIKHILYERECGDGFYDKSARLELEECIHFHYNDMRLFMNKDVFLKVSDMFAKARKKFDQLGQPEELKEMVLLDDCVLPENIAKNRIAIEIQADNRVHIHYNDLRIHINLSDLMVWFETFDHAGSNIPYEYTRMVWFDEAKYHPVVDEHVKFLKEYFDEGKHQNLNDWLASGEPSVTYKNRILESRFNVGDLKTRNFGLPEGFPAQVNPMLDHLYLIMLTNEIKENGYANGAFHKKYMLAYEYDDLSVQIINSHRLAVLKYLGHTKALCYVTVPDSGWNP
jgi:hypothetical protein